MERMENYPFAKLSDVNYNLAVHEADANHRLASQLSRILLISPFEIPEVYRKEFQKLHEVLKKELARTSDLGVMPSKLRSIKNKTASNYIKLLYLIEHSQDK